MKRGECRYYATEGWCGFFHRSIDEDDAFRGCGLRIADAEARRLALVDKELRQAEDALGRLRRRLFTAAVDDVEEG